MKNNIAKLSNIVAKLITEIEEDLVTFKNKPLRKLSSRSKMQGASGTEETKSLLNALEDSSNQATEQFTAKVEFSKKSNRKNIADILGKLVNTVSQLNKLTKDYGINQENINSDSDQKIIEQFLKRNT